MIAKPAKQLEQGKMMALASQGKALATRQKIVKQLIQNAEIISVIQMKQEQHALLIARRNQLIIPAAQILIAVTSKGAGAANAKAFNAQMMPNADLIKGARIMSAGQIIINAIFMKGLML